MRLVLPFILGTIFVSGCTPPDRVEMPTVVLVTAAGELTLDEAWSTTADALEWGEGRAFRLEPLLDGADDLRVVPEVGDAIVFEGVGNRRDGREPLLVVNRKGQAVVVVGDPDQGPSDFHGRGGARARSGDGGRRVVGVARLEATMGSATRSMKTTGPRPIVVVGPDGGTPFPSVTVAGLQPVPELPMTSDGGTKLDRGYRALRAIAERLFGGRRIQAIVDGGGTEVLVSEADWVRTDRTPVLRVNKQRSWRFQWVDRSGRPLRDAPGARNVARLVLTP